jgi:hypothetical protein
MPRQVAAIHVKVMTAPAMKEWPVMSAPMAVPDSSVATVAKVNGKWHGQMTKAPIRQTSPRFSVRLSADGVGHAVWAVLIGPADCGSG